MKENSIVNRTARQRRTITFVVSVLAALISGFFFYLMHLRFPHMHVIAYLTLGLSVLLVAYLVLWTLSAYKKYARLAKILRRCYFICLAIGLACFLVLQGLIISGARTEDAEADVLIVLGAGLWNNVPSLVLASRLDVAIAYMQAHPDIPVIVTGGLGRGEIITEAEAMSVYLIARGIDESRIRKEDSSTNTHEQMAFSIPIIEEMGLDIENIRVAVVSNEFHLYRSKLIAERAGLDAIGVAAETPGLHRRVIYFSREAFALLSEFLS